MKTALPIALVCLLWMACSKQSAAPTGNTGTNTNTATPVITTVAPSSISVFINDVAMPVTSIQFGRGGSTFNFLAQNKLQKVAVNCFWFYQQNWGNFQYSDSITYATRPDTLSNWTSTRANNYGTVNFDCCSGPLTDSLIVGNYVGDFNVNKDLLTIKGTFHLVFK